jgi:hypothetical protein
MSRSQAWKNAERQLATILGGQRVLRGADFSESDVDVVVADMPFLKFDSKYRARHSHHSLLEEIRTKYCKQTYDIPVLFTKARRQQGGCITIDADFFAFLLNCMRWSGKDPK